MTPATPDGCVICGGPLPLQAGGRVCAAAACQWKVRATPPGHLCVVCGGPLPATDLALTACRARGCLTALWDRQAREAVRIEAEGRRALHEALTGRAGALRAEAAPALGGAAAAYPLMVVPFLPNRPAPLPERRREAMRAFLEHLVQVEAGGGAGTGGEAPEAAGEAGRVLGEGCARCRGFCCQFGERNLAFIRKETIRRFRAANPGLTDEGVVGAYMARVGETTIEASCIFHQPEGCALPRAMRGDTCNEYICEGQRQYLAEIADGGPVRAFILAGDGAGPRAAAFVDEAGVRDVPVS